jgi:hypothetical protein
MAGKYQLYKDKAGKYRFRLVAENGRTIASGEAYERRTSCLNGIESVKKNSGSSIEDTTIDSPKIPFPKYQILLDKAGEYRFNLSASNGEVIASSEGYSSKDGCLNGINSLRRIANSEIEDLTTATEKQKETTIIEPGRTVIQKAVETSKQPEPDYSYKEETAKIPISVASATKLEETPSIEPEPKVVQKAIEPSKQPEPEYSYKEEDYKTPIPAAATTSKTITTSRNEMQIKQKGISPIAITVLIIGLVVGIILLAIGLGFGGILGAADVTAQFLMQVFGLLVICGSILFFFAKK